MAGGISLVLSEGRQEEATRTRPGLSFCQAACSWQSWKYPLTWHPCTFPKRPLLSLKPPSFLMKMHFSNRGTTTCTPPTHPKTPALPEPFVILGFYKLLGITEGSSNDIKMYLTSNSSLYCLKSGFFSSLITGTLHWCLLTFSTSLLPVTLTLSGFVYSILSDQCIASLICIINN